MLLCLTKKIFYNKFTSQNKETRMSFAQTTMMGMMMSLKLSLEKVVV